MKKRIFGLVIAVCVAVATMGVSMGVFAATPLTYKSSDRDVTYTYDKSTDTLTITGTGIALQEDVIAAKEAFENAGATFSLIHLVIGEDIEEIYTKFSNCTSLQSVTVRGNTGLRLQTFNGCTGLTSVTFLSDANIGNSVFLSCTSLTSIVIPGKAKIALTAFSGCTNLESVLVNGDVRLGSRVFYGCNNLKNAYFFGGVFYTGTDPFKSVDHNLNVYIGTSTAKTDYENRFTNSYITVIPMSGSCGATENDNVTWRLSADSTLTIGGTGNMADYENDNQPWQAIKSMVKSVIVEDGVTKIGENAFNGCNVSSICGYTGTAAETYANSSDNNFSFTPLNGTCGASGNEDKVTWKLSADGTMTISGSGKMADYMISYQPWASLLDMITSVVIEDGVTSVGASAFANCNNLTSADIADSVAMIGQSAFGSTALESVVLGCSDVVIKSNAFAGYKLTSVVIGGNADISNQAFAFNGDLKSVYFFGTTTINVTSVFYQASSDLTIYGYSYNSALQQYCQGNGIDFAPLNGTCSDTMIWSLAADGTLTIQGSDAMYDYSSTDAPWKDLVDNGLVKKFDIEKGITYESLGVTPKYTVVICDGTGKDVIAKYVFLTDGEKVPTPATPERNGYKFLGWYANGSEYYFDNTVSSDLLITAVWEKPDYVDTLNKAVDDLNKAVAERVEAIEFAAQIKDVKDAIDQLKSDLTGKAGKSALDDLTATVTALDNAIKVLQSAQSSYATTTDMNTAINSAIATVKSAQDTVIDELTKRLDDAETNIKNLTNNKANATELAKAVSEFATLTSTLNDLKHTLGNKDAELEGKITSAQTTLQGAIDELTKRLDDAETNIKNLTDGKASKNELEVAVEDLKALINALDSVKNNYVVADTTLENKLQMQINSANKAIEAAEKRIDVLEADVANIKQQVVDLEKAKDSLENVLKDKANASDVSKSIADLNDEITKLSDALSGKVGTTDFGALSDAVAALQAAVDTLNAAKNDYATADENLRSDLNTAIETAKNAAISASATLVENARTELNAAIDEKADSATVNARLQELQDAIDALDAVKNDYATADEKLKSDLNTAIESAKDAAISAANDALTKAKTELNEAIDKKADATALSNAITNLNNAISTAKKAAQDYADGKDVELKTTLENAISNAQTALQTSINKVASDLETAKTKLNEAISAGDKDLSDKITALNITLETAKTAFEKADADNKTELNKAISDAQMTLQTAVDNVQKNLDKAITDLNKAISDGDSDLSDKITSLNKAIETAKTALEKADADNKTDLDKAIADAQTALQVAIDKVASDLKVVKAELEAKDAEQQTFITVVCVIACVSLAGNVAIVITAFILKRKRKY